MNIPPQYSLQSSSSESDSESSSDDNSQSKNDSYSQRSNSPISSDKPPKLISVCSPIFKLEKMPTKIKNQDSNEVNDSTLNQDKYHKICNIKSKR